MPAPPLSIRFEVEEGIVLHCLEWSPISEARDATPVILLHGGGANAHWWDHLASGLAAKGPVYALDFRGHGDSTFPAEQRIGAFNDDLEGLIRWLGRDDVILIGHSMGAAVALDHASRFPRTKGIALIDLARGSQGGSGRRARLALSLRRNYRSREEAVARFRFLPESSRASEALRRHIAECSVQEEEGERFGYKFDPRWFALPSRPRPDLTLVECPTLLIRGEESALLSREAALDFIALLEAGKFVEIPDAGHHVLVDQPEALLAALRDFLGDLSIPNERAPRSGTRLDEPDD